MEVDWSTHYVHSPVLSTIFSKSSKSRREFFEEIISFCRMHNLSRVVELEAVRLAYKYAVKNKLYNVTVEDFVLVSLIIHNYYTHCLLAENMIHKKVVDFAVREYLVDPSAVVEYFSKGYHLMNRFLADFSCEDRLFIINFVENFLQKHNYNMNVVTVRALLNTISQFATASRIIKVAKIDIAELMTDELFIHAVKLFMKYKPQQKLLKVLSVERFINTKKKSIVGGVQWGGG